MSNVLKSYTLELEVNTPVYVGNGNTINKKEYIYDNIAKKAFILEPYKLYQYMKNNKLGNEYEKYILKNTRDSLNVWLREHNIHKDEYDEFIRYELECKDVFLERGKTLAISEFIKDGYGCPYIPGSSLKGMLRTILLCSDLVVNKDKYVSAKQNLQRSIPNRISRRYYLSKETKKIEAKRYCLLNRPGDKVYWDNPVNDILSGMIVGDSEPLSSADLTLCQKVDIKTDGDKKRLNIYRESLKPGTIVRFPITIDTSICEIGVNDIMEAINVFADMYYKNYLNKFPAKYVSLPAKGMVWIGGGTGFATKTIIYSMFGQPIAVKLIANIFDNINVPKMHKHYRDEQLGVAPHMLKCTEYKGQTVQMGLCSIKIF